MKQWIEPLIAVIVMLLYASIVLYFNGCAALKTERTFEYSVDCEKCKISIEGDSLDTDRHLLKGF